MHFIKLLNGKSLDTVDFTSHGEIDVQRYSHVLGVTLVRVEARVEDRDLPIFPQKRRGNFYELL